ncbi:MAG: ABC-F family ATP-binding cassette domain-containing protein [Herpetosiphonaceae bacterium]|nr:ABC-F family ATP-binding cassette domain-containing protein [Herpetosiphonaceae bacterium]
MHLLSVESVSKQFDDRALFTALSFGMERGERIGVIGVNGSGKSTLLRIIAGAETPDTGRVSINGSVRVAYLGQNPQMDGDKTVLEHLFAGEGERMQLVRNYEAAVLAVQQHPDDQAALLRLGELSERMELTGAWETERHAKTILSQLGIVDTDALLRNLSGGQRRRVALAAALIDPADLLILDEPTNHLDADTVAWLETELTRTPTALLLVTHDRYFLDRVVKRILALEGGKLWDSQGGYSEYVRRRAERVEAQATVDQRRSSILRKELAWMLQGAQARSTKQKARIQRFETMRDEPTAKSAAALSMTVPSAQRLGKRVIELKHVAKSFGGRQLFDDLTLTLERGERLGIVGPNASGKTTLLNMLAGRLTPDAGEVVVGETVRLAYYDQESTALNLDQRVIEYLEDEAPLVQTADGSIVTAAQMLERFLFDAKAQYARVGTLSGGERRRLYLLRTLLFAPNVLLLDEPTNDLDVETLAILEDYLDDWAGTLIVASHDRYFLDRTVDHLLTFDHGVVVTFPGSYTTYAEARQGRKQPLADERRPGLARSAPSKAAPMSSKPRTSSFKAKRELDILEARIAELEATQARLNARLAEGSGDYQELEQMSNELVETNTVLEDAMERWVELSELMLT